MEILAKISENPRKMLDNLGKISKNPGKMAPNFV